MEPTGLNRSWNNMEISLFFSYVLMLLMVTNPLGNIPLFLASMRQVPDSRKARVIMRELTIALGIMMFFLLFGKYFLKALSLDVSSMAIGGGIILFIISMQMIFPTEHMLGTDTTDGEPFIVPLAIPLVAGPSVITMVMLFSARNQGSLVEWTGVIVTTWVINAVILAGLSVKLSRLLGTRGLVAIEKLMGMILATMSTQMVINAIKQILQK
ncbi:MAG: MarC family protein [Elusimicrobiales bacterium]|nr:MarC family protein [Elusimicrobiales bacterium]